MWAPIVLCLLVATANADNAWKAGAMYTYNIQGRTLTGLHQVANQFSGVVVSGDLTVHPGADNRATLVINNAKYADVQANFSRGWLTEIPESQLHYTDLPISNDPFELHFENGAIKKMVVNKDVAQWQLNFYKSIASQFQLDTQGQNLKKSKINLLPEQHQGDPMGSYKTMEDSVNGIYETIYDISPLPEYVLQHRPELAPLPHLKGEGQFINIVKTRNFSNSEKHLVYRYGSSGNEGWEAGSSQMGNILSRSSQSRAVLSGTLERYAIQSTVTTEKVLLAPHLYNSQKGIVVSHMNITLQELKNAEGSQPQVKNPREVENLVYEYNSMDGIEGGQQGGSNESSSVDSSDSSSSSSSSEENMSSMENSLEKKEKLKDRIKRSLEQLEKSKKRLNKSSNKSVSRESSSSSSSSSSSDSSSSVSSSEEYLPRTPGSIKDAPMFEFQPGYYMGSVGPRKGNVVEQIKRFAQKIGQWVERPGSIPDDSQLALFSKLIRFISNANSQQLEEASQSLYQEHDKEQSQSNDSRQKYQAWLAFRDATAQAGTGPALVMIRMWIDSNQVQGEEAAQLLSVLPYAARYPNTEYMNYFFEMIKSGNVRKQQFLNSTGVFAFTDLVRKSQVDHEVSHNRYPVHLHGKDSKQHRLPVTEKYIPYLQEQLGNAVSQGDSHKIQVYIRALGNTAHPKIMSVFEPYLEGKTQISNFQRQTIIESLDNMAKTHPNSARAVLFRIYQNTAEVPEVRSAAVRQLMKTNPPAQMLQRMADFTNYDYSEHVNSAVKSAIESAASSTDFTVSPELNQNARTAANMLNPRIYGAQFSKTYLSSYNVEGQDLQYEQLISLIQSQDSLYPSSLMYQAQQIIGGYQRDPHTVYLSTSSSNQFLNLISRVFGQGGSNKKSYRTQSREENDGSEYSYQNIRNMLKLETDEAVQAEGNILVSMLGGKRFFSFDNHTVEQIPQYLNSINEQLQRNAYFQKTKYYNQYSLEIGFPLAMGLPFVYSFDVPSIVSASGKLNGQLEQQMAQQKENEQYSLPLKANIAGEFEFIYSTQKIGLLGFVAPFSQNRYIAGLEKNFHTYVPVKGSIQYNPKENQFHAKIQPNVKNNQQEQIFQYSTKLYTTYQPSGDLRPHSQGSNTAQIYTQAPQWYQRSVGKEETGFAFNIVGYQSQPNYLHYFYNALRRHDPVSAFLYYDMSNSIESDYLSVKYNPQESSQEGANIDLTFTSDEQGNRASAMKSSSRMNSNDNLAQPGSYIERRNELLRNVQGGIQDATSHLFDASVTFGAQGNSGYSLTVAHSNSPVSPKSRVLIYYRGKPAQQSQNTNAYQAALQFDIEDPQVPAFSYRDALNVGTPSQVQGKLNIGGEGSNYESEITFQGKLERSEERKEYVRQHPQSKVCEEQMQRRNYIQSACRNATLSANYQDKYTFSFNYRNVPSGLRRVMYSAYGMVRQALYQHNEENVFPKGNEENKVRVQVEFEPNLQSVNVSLAAPGFSSRFSSVQVNNMARPFVVYHPQYNTMSLLRQKLYEGEQPLATAVIDGNQVVTFNNQTYPVDLGNCYHVFAMYAPQEYRQQSKGARSYRQGFAVLVKQTDSEHKEAKVVLENDVLELKPSGSKGVTIQANGQEIKPSETKIARWSKNNNNIEVHAHPDNTAVLNFPNHGLILTYDGSRVQLAVASNYWNNLRGLAGAFDGQQVFDFTGPNNRIYRNPLLFAATYALTDSSCQGPAKGRQEQAKQAPNFEKRYIFGNVVSEREAGREQEEKSNEAKAKTRMAKQQSCTQMKTHIVEESERTCFSTKPQPACSSHCKPSGQIQKYVDFHCIQNSSAARLWAQTIRKGATPDFSGKGANRQISLNLPTGCEIKA